MPGIGRKRVYEIDQGFTHPIGPPEQVWFYQFQNLLFYGRVLEHVDELL